MKHILKPVLMSIFWVAALPHSALAFWGGPNEVTIQARYIKNVQITSFLSRRKQDQSVNNYATSLAQSYCEHLG